MDTHHHHRSCKIASLFLYSFVHSLRLFFWERPYMCTFLLCHYYVHCPDMTWQYIHPSRKIKRKRDYLRRKLATSLFLISPLSRKKYTREKSPSQLFVFSWDSNQKQRGECFHIISHTWSYRKKEKKLKVIKTEEAEKMWWIEKRESWSGILCFFPETQTLLDLSCVHLTCEYITDSDGNFPSFPNQLRSARVSYTKKEGNFPLSYFLAFIRIPEEKIHSWVCLPLGINKPLGNG